jgi:hypothetical protein
MAQPEGPDWLRSIHKHKVGNLISLPPGPIWLLHAFYTISSVLLLIQYCRFNVCRIGRH